jgi:hypothetical protein
LTKQFLNIPKKEKILKVEDLIKDLKENYKPNDVLAVDLWNVEDVRECAESNGIKLKKDEPESILYRMQKNQDAEIGFNNDVLYRTMLEIVTKRKQKRLTTTLRQKNDLEL